MERLVLALFLLILLVTFTVPVHASINVQSVIDQDIHAVFDFENIDPPIYNDIIQLGLFDVSTIPDTINGKFAQQNLIDARCNYDPTQEIFDSSTNSIHVECYLSGSDILNFTINTENMTRTYRVRTDWRKLHVNLTQEFSLDFINYFASPVSQWKKVNYTLNEKTHPAYYTSTSPNQIDSSFYFILPEKAKNVHAVDDIIIFEAPLSFEESFLDSPFLILAVLMVVDVIVLLYRRVRK